MVLFRMLLIKEFRSLTKIYKIDSFEEASKTAGIAQKAIWYINGALLALNDILGAIIPQAEELNGGIATGVDDAVDDYDKLTSAVNGSLASFDKFNTLSGGSGGLDLTGGLSQLFDKEYKEYIEKFEESMKSKEREYGEFKKQYSENQCHENPRFSLHRI